MGQGERERPPTRDRALDLHQVSPRVFMYILTGGPYMYTLGRAACVAVMYGHDIIIVIPAW